MTGLFTFRLQPIIQVQLDELHHTNIHSANIICYFFLVTVTLHAHKLSGFKNTLVLYIFIHNLLKLNPTTYVEFKFKKKKKKLYHAVLKI